MNDIIEQLKNVINVELKYKLSLISQKFDIPMNQLIELIDLANEIKIVKNRDTLFFPDGIHFNNKGSMLASSLIAAHLKKLLASAEARR